MKPIYRQFEPSLKLRSCIESVWVQQSAAALAAAPTTVLPNGRVTLVLQFADSCTQLIGERSVRMPRCHVVGQQSGPIKVQAGGAPGFVIVRFRPWGARALFGDALCELDERIVDLELMWEKHDIAGLVERLHISACHGDRVRYIEQFLADRLQDEPVDEIPVAAISQMNNAWGRCRVTSIARHFGLSRHQFNRRFTRSIGTSPKKLLGVLRAQKALASLKLGLGALDVVDLCGYTDQSHLIHDIARRFSRRPRDLRNPAVTGLQKTFNQADASEYCGLAYL